MDHVQARPGKKNTRSIHMSTVSTLAVLVSVVLVAALILSTFSTITAYQDLQDATEEYVACNEAVNEMEAASDYLTSQVRVFVNTADMTYLKRYFREADETKRREHAIENPHVANHDARKLLEQALELSNDLMERELHAARLVIDAFGYDIPDNMSVLESVELSPEEQALSKEEKHVRAKSLVLDKDYQHVKDLIGETLNQCNDKFAAETKLSQAQSANAFESLLLRIQVLGVLSFIAVLATVWLLYTLVLNPLALYVKRVSAHEDLPAQGSHELRYLAKVYNAMYEKVQGENLRLQHEAEHDPLTGLYNRGAYDKLREVYHSNIALILIDVDHFKDANDNYGHGIGDEILQKVAALLTENFRTTDFPCRIGGDEFAVIMTDITYELGYVAECKIEHVSKGLLDTSDGLPATTLSIGIAFSESPHATDDILKDADKALYQVKKNGRNGHAFYEDIA